MFALVDCNNFYISCERVFNPKLRNVPVLILSNNDGCIIARSNEVRDLGIKMGQPYFEVKNICKINQVRVLSSNYALYGDMSRRVMSILKQSCALVEIYSIDEAFVSLNIFDETSIQDFALDLYKKILRYTGIPVSIGVGNTKTQAKLANYIAKREINNCYFNLTNNLYWYKLLKVSEVWGIGRNLFEQLSKIGVNTVYDLSILDPFIMRKKFNVMIMRTILELNGQTCLPLGESTQKKSIISSRSFENNQTEFAPVFEALACFCGRASEKLREQKLVAGRVSVFLRTNMYQKNLIQRSASKEIKLIMPTNDVRVITHWAKKCLMEIFKAGYNYKKVGVCLDDLSDVNAMQMDLFLQENFEKRQSSTRLMEVLDNINKKYGIGTLKTAAEGLQKRFAGGKEYCSPAYTTSWLDLPKVKL